ncbi:nucleoside hydrolase-like isoform X2 [Dermacentor albipictus]|uniref:nucleoside hydrolase-like isoform X2 n=1 Tax=Dermacentor albipictus TaxID=60249 RepID=UPI0038FCAA4B
MPVYCDFGLASFSESQASTVPSPPSVAGSSHEWRRQRPDGPGPSPRAGRGLRSGRRARAGAGPEPALDRRGRHLRRREHHRAKRGEERAQGARRVRQKRREDVTSKCPPSPMLILRACSIRRSFKHLPVPVYRGCEQPLSQPLDFADQYHGCDGLGDVQDQFPCTDDDEDDDDGSVDGRPMHAAEKLIEMARREPGQITLLLLGPLTNAALALTLDPRFGANLKEIFILGGNVEGRGNVLPGAEFNFKADPEAANVVLTRAQCPITIVPWEAVVKSPIPWEVYSMMTRQDTAKSRFVSAITRFTLRYYDDVASGGYEVGDALAVAAVLAPDSVASALEHRRVAVELGGVHTRGQLVHAWTPDLLPDVKRTVRVVTAFNKERVSELLMRMVV